MLAICFAQKQIAMTADKKLSAQNSRLPFVISCLEIRISVENPYF